NLVYNASLLVDEGLGYAVTLDKLLNTQGSSLCFRPLCPPLSADACLVWKKYQVFSRAARLFLDSLRDLLAPQEPAAPQ
ncbi:MAG: LysR family transcriptional regulator, partial [Candidatus Spyradocola sp.]